MEVAGVGPGFAVELLREREDELASLRMELRRHDERLLCATEPEEAPRLGTVARPRKQTAGVELAVAGIEPAPHHAGRQIGDR